MQRLRIGRDIAVVLSIALIAVLLNAAHPGQVAGQGPGSSSYTVFLPQVQKAPSRGSVGDTPPTVGLSTPYRAFSDEEAVPGQALVKWRDGVDLDTISRINAQYGVQVVGMIQGLDVHILQVAPEVTADILAVYGALPEVEYAEPNFIAWGTPAEAVGPVLSRDELRPDTLNTNDPQAGQQYSLTKMNVRTAWDVTRGDGVVVAILDTGVDFAHPDLIGKFVSSGRDFINNDSDASDDHGHGTHVSGITAAATNNGVGIAGVGYNTRLLPVKVLASNGSGNHGQIASGIMWAADQGVKVLNMSLGGPYGSATLENAINYAWNKGVVVIAAAGNDNTSNPSYPASYTNAIGICATDANDNKASFSNYGGNVDVCAPGVSILSTVRGGSYQSWNGTSMAAPNAAGVAALVAAAHPDWKNAQIRAALEGTTDNLGNSTYFGRGRLNAGRAVGSSSPPPPGPTSPAPPQPTPTRTPTPQAPPPGGGDYAQQIVNLINGARAQNGLGPLRYDYRLKDAADFHNRWMRDQNCFSHNCPGEPDVFQRMRNAGYPVTSGGENIGKGYQTPQDMLTGWMNSSGHRAAILNTYWPDIGCGYLRGPSGYAWDSYWSCEFARGNDSAPPPAPTRTPAPGLPTATRTPIPNQPTPTRTPTPIAPPPQPGSLVLTPPSNLVGWVNSASIRGWGDDDMYTGWYGNSIYVAGIQIPLDAIPSNANIVGAQLELTGQTTEYITAGTSGNWFVRWLSPTFDGLFPNTSYTSLTSAPVMYTLSPGVTAGDLAAYRRNVFVFNSQQLASLKSQRLSSGRISFRIDGPTVGPYNNTMSWDSGWGTGGLGGSGRPVLRVTLGP